MTDIPSRNGESSTSTSAATSIKDTSIELQYMSEVEKAEWMAEQQKIREEVEDGDVRAESGVHYRSDAPPTFWTRFDAMNQRLERKIGIESRGIERVPDFARTDMHLYGNTFIWLAANTVLPTFGLGVLGPAVFGLGLGDSLITIALINIFAAMLPACAATFGVKLGLRQMTSARFSWGWHGAKIVAFLNCIACVGWSIVNTVSGTQTLVALAEYKISSAVGVVIIALATLAVGMFGYKVVHTYERFSWIPTAITFLVLLGIFAKHLVNTPMGTGQAEAASILSFSCTLVGYTFGWTSLAGDYNVYMPSESPPFKIAAWTYLGLIFPLVLCEWLGAAVSAAAQSGQLPAWKEAYASHELGGLLGQVFIPAMGNGGKFFMMLLVLSVVSNNIINVYSMGFSVSVVHHWLAAVPRLLWPIVITAIYLPVSIVAANSFADSLTNFLDVLAYWLTIYNVVVWEEHLIFRKGDWTRYQVAGSWNDKSRVPIGFAAVGAALFGVMGAVLGMAQVWYIGPIGMLVGGDVNSFGGDIGWLLAPAFTGVTFPVFRLIERRLTGR